jgi:hypothetical protein
VPLRINKQQQKQILCLTGNYYTMKTCLSTGFLAMGLFFYLVCEAIGTAATPGLLCQPRVIVKMIVERHSPVGMSATN